VLSRRQLASGRDDRFTDHPAACSNSAPCRAPSRWAAFAAKPGHGPRHVKATLTAGVPVDVLEHASRYPRFPSNPILEDRRSSQVESRRSSLPHVVREPCLSLQPSNRPEQMSLGQLLLVYGLIPVLILTVIGIQRARRANAGWVAWSPVLLYLATIIVAFLMGFATVAFDLPQSVTPVLVSFTGLGAAVSGVWLFFRYGPKDAA
jgi:hypothetical protein